MTFGFYRSEVIGAFFSILIIWLLTGVLVFLAIRRVITQDYEIESNAMVITASCGVGFNIIMFIVLHTDRCFGVKRHHGHSHDDHSHNENTSSSSNDHRIDVSTHQTTTAAKYSSSLESPTQVSVILNDPSDHRVEFVNGSMISHDDHGHHEQHKKKEKPEKNINMRAAAIHVIGDFIQSVGVLTAALIIYFKVIIYVSNSITVWIQKSKKNLILLNLARI